ncbi:MAG: hypothetical protein ABI865_15835, partial [Nitrosospira sp.]
LLIVHDYPRLKNQRVSCQLGREQVARLDAYDQTPHLYTSWQWKYDVVSDEEAKDFIQKKDWEKK